VTEGAAPAGDETGRLPDFLVIGAAKSGTTSLAKWLDAREDVYVPARKELHFFDRMRTWEHGAAWYAAQFAGAGAGVTKVGEATPPYLAHAVAAERIAATVPDVRLIALLREPAERAWSHFAYDRDIGHPTTPFEAMVASAGREDEHQYVRIGRYVRHLERITSLLSRDQLLVVWFDDLRDRPAEVWRTVCAFLDLAPDPVPDAVGTAHNRHYRVRLRGAQGAMKRWHLWRRLPWFAGRLDRFLRDEGGYDSMPPALGDALRASYAPDNRELAAWLGRPLPDGWSR
jgi:hypothetical protein